MKRAEEVTEKEVREVASEIFRVLEESKFPPSAGTIILLEMVLATVKALGHGKKELSEIFSEFLKMVPPDDFDV